MQTIFSEPIVIGLKVGDDARLTLNGSVEPFAVRYDDTNKRIEICMPVPTASYNEAGDKIVTAEEGTYQWYEAAFNYTDVDTDRIFEEFVTPYLLSMG